jgi:Fe-S-cluster containining protein
VIADQTMRPALARTAADPSGTAAAAPAPDSDDMCRTCGACCSYSADWPRFSLETEELLVRIPRELVAEDEHGMRCSGARCAALVGVVGRSTSCAIYPLRPDVCRACLPGDPECLEARRHFGLSSGVRNFA